MICPHCKKKLARIVLINEKDESREDWAYCCDCFVKDFREKIFDAANRTEDRRN